MLEETGITVSTELGCMRSVTFTMADGTPVVDVFFLGDYESGEPRIANPDEVAEMRLVATEDHPHSRKYTALVAEKCRASRIGQTTAESPPSTLMATPVMKLARSEARNVIRSATSLAVPIRPMGT